MLNKKNIHLMLNLILLKNLFMRIFHLTKINFSIHLTLLLMMLLKNKLENH